MNARILERQRYLEMMDATFQLRDAQIYRKRRLWAVSTAHFSFGMLFVGMA